MNLNIKKNLLWYYPFLVISTLVIIIFYSFFRVGVPVTHDGQGHLARIANFYIAIRDFHFPPRWAPNLNYKFGYPAFNFYYPLGYYLALPFFLLTQSPELAYKIVIVLTTFIGASYFYLFLKKHFHKSSAIVSSLLFYSSPMFLAQIFVRGAYGEVMTWAIFPISLYFFDRYLSEIENNKLKLKLFLLTVVSIFLLAHSHNMIFLFFLAFLTLYTLIKLLLGHPKSLKLFVLSFLPIILGLSLSSYYFIPMIFEASYTSVKEVGLSKYYYKHFVYPLQFVFSDWGYGYSVEGNQDGISFQHNIVQTLLLIPGLAFLLKGKSKNKQKKLQNPLVLTAIITFLVSLFFSTEYSLPLWKIINPLKLIQFPWRLLFLSNLALTIISSYILDKLNFSKLSYFLLIVSCSLVIFVGYNRPQSLSHADKYAYLEYPLTSSTMNELKTREFSTEQVSINDAYKEPLINLNGDSQFDIQKWKTSYHSYKVQLSESSQLLERIMYFPGWQVFIDGQKTNIDYLYPDHKGIITYFVPAGEHKVITKFTEDTPARIIGDSISLVSLTVIIYLLIKNKNAKIK